MLFRSELVEKKMKDEWQFTFLGADYNAFAAGPSMGFASASTSNFNKMKSNHAYNSVSDGIMRMCTQIGNGQVPQFAYTDKERVEME